MTKRARASSSEHAAHASGAPEKKRPRITDLSMLEDKTYDYNFENLSTQQAARIIEKKAEKEKSNGGKQKKNKPADGGIIKEVFVENFMCHPSLSVPLGPFINFIIGHNGSGKSAILTAITICLGGSAQITNRGTSLKSFIKSGEDYFRVTVKIKNEGEGFKQKEYGNTIIIERRHTINGGNSYFTRNEKGTVVGKNKTAIDEVLDHYGLQINNPMTVLTQDMARQFLNKSTPAQKYKLFSQGVMLEKLDQDYRILEEQIDALVSVSGDHVENLRALEATKDKLLEKVNQLEQQDGLRQELIECQLMYAWSQIQDREALVQDAEDKVKHQESKIQKGKDEIEQSTADFDKASAEMEAATARKTEAEADVAPYEDALKEAHEHADQKEQDINTAMRDQREAKVQVSDTEKKITEAEEQVKKEESRLAQQNGGSTAQLLDEQNRLTGRIQELKEERQKLEDESNSDQRDIDNAKNLLAEASKTQSDKRTEWDNENSQLRSIQESGKNSWAAFPPDMQHLVQLINQNQRRFREKPIGPVGHHVSLADSQWLTIIERMLGGTLSSFIVTSHEDGKVLQELKSQTRNRGQGINLAVITAKRLNLAEPAPEFVTINRVLKIDNDLVRQHLIVSHAIEQSILFEDIDEANKVMDPSRRHRGDNISLCFARNMEAFRAGRGEWAFKVGGAHGSAGVSPVHPWIKASHMKTDRCHQERNALERISRAEDALAQAREAYTRKQTIFDDTKNRVNSRKAKIKNLGTEIERLDDRSEELTNKVDEISRDGQLQVYQNIVENHKSQLQSYKSQTKDMEEKVAKLYEELDELKATCNGAEQNLTLAKKAVSDAEREWAAADNRRQTALRHKNFRVTRLQEYEKALEEDKAQLEADQEQLEIDLSQARTCGDRVLVPDGLTTEDLGTKLGRLDRQIEDAEKVIGGSKEKISHDFQAAAVAFQSKKDLIESTQISLELLQESYAERKERWAYFRHYISARARAQFTYMMSQRGFHGRLDLKHGSNPPELILEVEPAGGDSGNRGPKTLSGGEKSFSTICLLLALWEAMGSTIRCLDEFDVFMDSINRSISLGMMTSAAKRSVGKQFIFITPQDMGSMDDDLRAQCKIYRMLDPERRQGRLNFERQG